MNSNKNVLATTLGLALLVAAAGLTPHASAAPQPAGEDATAKTYIVKTKSVSSASGVASAVGAAGGKVKNVYQRVYPGFSARLTASQAHALRGNPRVVSVVPDQAVHSTVTQSDPTWGLDRIDQRSTGGDGTYSFDTTGAGVTAYIVDTGIRTSHHQFGGRAASGFDFVDEDADASDCNGHGTHVSGTVGGSRYGVAKGVELVGVRVLDCEGSGTTEGVIAGIDWVVAHRTGPSVISMSLAGEAFAPLDAAVEAASAAGVAVVVAASNEDEDACGFSPSRAPSAITVGATDATDARATFSNWGHCVDLFAPGVNVLSSWVTDDDATSTFSGTSMATPHVSGIVARYQQAHPSATPAEVTAALLAAATPGTVVDRKGSPNLLAYAAPPVLLPGTTVIQKATSGSRTDAAVSVTSRWAKPTTGGPVETYTVTAIRKSDGATKTVKVSAAVRSKKITGLKKGASYVVKVYAKNAAGRGAFSKTSNTVRAR
jgi:subtilisin family serine protease